MPVQGKFEHAVQAGIPQGTSRKESSGNSGGTQEPGRPTRELTAHRNLRIPRGNSLLLFHPFFHFIEGHRNCLEMRVYMVNSPAHASLLVGPFRLLPSLAQEYHSKPQPKNDSLIPAQGCTRSSAAEP